MIERAVILAIGNPYHRSVLTYSRAPAMLPALGKPLVARVMDRLHRIGIRKYTIVVGENEGAVAGYLNTQWLPNVEIDFALRSGMNNLQSILSDIARKYGGPLLICSYNSFTHNQFPRSLIKSHTDNPNALILSGAMASLSKSQQHHYAIMDGTTVKQIALSKQIDQTAFTLTDLAVCGQDFIDFLASPPESTQKATVYNWQFMDIVQQFVNSEGNALVTETSWILQIEADRDLLTLNKHLLDEGQDAHILSELPYTVQIISPVRIDPQVNVGQGAKIGPYVYLERGCSVGHNVSLRNTILLERANVPAERAVADTIISTRGPIP